MIKHALLAAVLLVVGAASCEKGEMGDGSDKCERCTYTFRGNTGTGSLIFEYKNYFLEGLMGYRTTAYRGLSVEVPAGVNVFNYGDKEIAGDKVNYLFMCVNCGAITFEPVGGTIKGRKIDDRTWLLDAKVYLESQTDQRDTLIFKQFFTK